MIGKLVYVVFGFRAAWSDKLLFRGGTLLVRENYNLAASVQLWATPYRESRAEPLSPLGETSAQSADTSCESTATLRAGAQSNVQKALKGCGGKQEFSPTSNMLNTKVPFLKNSPVDCFWNSIHAETYAYWLIKTSWTFKGTARFFEARFKRRTMLPKQSTGLFRRNSTFEFNMLHVGENSRAIPKAHTNRLSQ